MRIVITVWLTVAVFATGLAAKTEHDTNIRLASNWSELFDHPNVIHEVGRWRSKQAQHEQPLSGSCELVFAGGSLEVGSGITVVDGEPIDSEWVKIKTSALATFGVATDARIQAVDYVLSPIGQTRAPLIVHEQVRSTLVSTDHHFASFELSPSEAQLLRLLRHNGEGRQHLLVNVHFSEDSTAALFVQTDELMVAIEQYDLCFDWFYARAPATR